MSMFFTGCMSSVLQERRDNLLRDKTPRSKIKKNKLQQLRKKMLLFKKNLESRWILLSCINGFMYVRKLDKDNNSYPHIHIYSKLIQTYVLYILKTNLFIGQIYRKAWSSSNREIKHCNIRLS